MNKILSAVLIMGLILGFILSMLFVSIAISAPDDPDWDPGIPVPYSWSDIELMLWWPDSYTSRAVYWGCLARASNADTHEAYQLEFQVVPYPPNEAHRFMHTIFAFGSGNWVLTEGSCFILNRNGTVTHTVAIGDLPWWVSVQAGPRVYMPAIER